MHFIYKVFHSLKSRTALLLIVMGILSATVLTYSFNISFDHFHDISGENAVENARHLFRNFEINEKKHLSSNISIINNSESIKYYLENRERDSLYNSCKEIFRFLSDKQGVTQMNFLDNHDKKTCFLRMGNKTHFGDIVSRASYQNALKTNALISGIELENTSLMIRVIMPMYQKYNLIGFVEMAKNIDEFLEQMRGETENEYAIYIYKKFASESDWGAKKVLNGKRNNWNDFEDILLVSSTNSRLMPVNGIDLKYESYANQIYDRIKLGSKIYTRGSFPIYDLNDKHIGSVLVMNDITTEYKKLNNKKNYSIILVVALILIMVTVLFVNINNLMNRVRVIAHNLSNVSKGILNKSNKSLGKDEIGELQQIANTLSVNFSKISDFAIEINKGNLDADFLPLSENDRIGNSLLQMQKSLKKAKEEDEKRFTTEEEQKWMQNGFTIFNDLLRQRYSDLKELGYAVIKELIDYLDTILAGIFIYNEDRTDEKKLELIASYAYDRRKNIQKAIEPGEGLVGACALEKKVSIFDKLPDDYIEITSGLGNSVPGFLIIVPLLVDDKILGVIELASIHSMSETRIDFLKRIAEIVASSLSTTKMNQRTAMLVDRLQRQSEIQAMNEEELRQNLEELQATQENRFKEEVKAKVKEQQLNEEMNRLKAKIEELTKPKEES